MAPGPVGPGAFSRSAAQAGVGRACAAREPTCDWVMTFSSLEKVSIRRTLARLALEVEPAPWGKVIGTIHIHNEDVFAERNWLRFFNHFHFTTRKSATRGELTFADGLPDHLRHGLFAESRSYRALVRFAGPGPLAPPGGVTSTSRRWPPRNGTAPYCAVPFL